MSIECPRAAASELAQDWYPRRPRKCSEGRRFGEVWQRRDELGARIYLWKFYGAGPGSCFSTAVRPPVTSAPAIQPHNLDQAMCGFVGILDPRGVASADVQR